MKEIKQIYYNDSGTSFYWKKEDEIVMDKVQLVFKETGFYYTIRELQKFMSCIDESFMENNCCDDCALKNQCSKFLLKTVSFSPIISCK